MICDHMKKIDTVYFFTDTQLDLVKKRHIYNQCL